MEELDQLRQSAYVRRGSLIPPPQVQDAGLAALTDRNAVPVDVGDPGESLSTLNRELRAQHAAQQAALKPARLVALQVTFTFR